MNQKQICCINCYPREHTNEVGCQRIDCQCHQKQSWEEEFDYKISHTNNGGGWWLGDTDDIDEQELKDFIKQAISTREREISEEVGKKSSNGVVDSHAWIFVKEVLSIINNK